MVNNHSRAHAVIPPHADPWDELANAIVIRAVDDYKAALRKLQMHPHAKEAQHIKRSLEIFFGSEWCRVLTSVDMVAVARTLRATILGTLK